VAEKSIEELRLHPLTADDANVVFRARHIRALFKVIDQQEAHLTMWSEAAKAHYRLEEEHKKLQEELKRWQHLAEEAWAKLDEEGVARIVEFLNGRTKP
jgi:hypothetical protein